MRGIALFVLVGSLPLAAQSPKPIVPESFNLTPLRFEQGADQFAAHAPGYRVRLGKGSAAVEAGVGKRLRIKLPRGLQPEVDTSSMLPGKISYISGNDPSKWRMDVPQYARVKYAGIAPGIDLVFHGNQRRLEYDVVVAPGAQPASVKLQFEGARRLSIDDGGNLLLETPAGVVTQDKPYIYQTINGGRRHVEGKYLLKGRNAIGFEVADYDPSLPLVIDPTLSVFSYFGGGGYDQITGMAEDPAGNIFVTGFTLSNNFPATNPFQSASGGGTDAFVVKFAPGTATVLSSTYIGGLGNDYAYGLALAPDGSLFIAGQTNSSNFPTKNPFRSTLVGGNDCFVTHLNGNLNSLIGSTFLGGTGDDSCNGIAIDPRGNPFVTGTTASRDFPTMSPFQSTFQGGPSDAFVTEFQPGLNALLFSTFVGGSGTDVANGIAVDPTGAAFIIGGTNSTNFPTSSTAFQTTNKGGSDAFVLRIVPNNPAIFSGTLLGGSGNDVAYGIALGQGLFPTAFITGSTGSTNFPILNGAQPLYGGGTSDGFLAGVAVNASVLTYSTFMGGSGADSGSGVFVDPVGRVYVVGDAGSTNFPFLNGVQSSYAGGTLDTFFQVLDAAGKLLASSIFGGSGLDSFSSVLFDPTRLTMFAAGTSFCTPGQPGCGGGTGDAVFAGFSGVAPCGFSVPSTGPTFAGAGAAYNMTVLTYPGCPWTASSDSPWIALSSPTLSGTGTSVIPYNVFENPAPDKVRTGHLTVGGQTLSVTQAPSLCSYAFTSELLGVNFGGGNTRVGVTTGAGCPWSALGRDNWIQTIPSSGTGSGFVDVFFGENPSNVQRKGMLDLTGGSIPITQSGGPPAANTGGTVGAAFPGMPVGGGAASLYGTNFGVTTFFAGAVPLPTASIPDGVSINITSGSTPGVDRENATGSAGIGPIRAPLFFASPGQINFQMPWEFLGQSQVTLTVTALGVTSAPVTVNLSPTSVPAIFTINQQGTGQGAIQLANTTTFAAPVNSIPGVLSKPATVGDYLTIYCTGLGDVTNRPASGAAGPGGPLSSSIVTPTATIGGVNAPVLFSGLTPNFVGLYQVNVQVPAGVTPGPAVQLVIKQGNATSNPVTVAIQ